MKKTIRAIDVRDDKSHRHQPYGERCKDWLIHKDPNVGTECRKCACGKFGRWYRNEIMMHDPSITPN